MPGATGPCHSERSPSCHSRNTLCHSERSEESPRIRFFTLLRSVQNDIGRNAPPHAYPGRSPSRIPRSLHSRPFRPHERGKTTSPFRNVKRNPQPVIERNKLLG